MKQLELPLKFKPNTYESYTDTQKKEYWYANYCIQLQKIDTAVRMLRDEADLLDRRATLTQYNYYSKMARRIREICNDLKDKK